VTTTPRCSLFLIGLALGACVSTRSARQISTVYGPSAPRDSPLAATTLAASATWAVEASQPPPTQEAAPALYQPPIPSFGENINFVKAVGQLLAVGDTSGSLTLLDTSDPTRPIPVSNISLGTEDVLAIRDSDMAFPEAAEIRGVEAQDRRLYVITITQLFLFDISDPAKPINLGRTTLPERLNDMQLRGSDLWVVIADTWNDRVLLMVLDASNPSRVIVRSEVELPGTRVARVRMNGDTTFVTVRDNLVAEDLKFYDTSDPAQVPKVYRVRGLPAFRAWVSGQTAYIATGRRDVAKPTGYFTQVASVALVDITHPDDPRTISYIWAPDLATDLSVAGHTAFIIGDQLSDDWEPSIWFYVVDLEDPTHPSILHSVRFPGQAQQMTMLGGYAYVAAGDSGLHIVDPAAARLVGTLSATDLRSQ